MSTALFFADAVISTGDRDDHGDILRPLGVDVRPFLARPIAGLEHLWHDGTGNATRSGRGVPIIAAWLRKSLARPGAPAEIGIFKAGRSPVLAGRIFFGDDPLSVRAFTRVVSGELRGVSVEARPLARDGAIVSRWELVGVSLCRRPANEFAIFKNYGRVRDARPLCESF